MRLWAAFLAATVSSTLLAGCMADPLPEPIVRDFLLAWQQGSYREAAGQTTGSSGSVAGALERAVRQLNAHDLRMKIDRIEVDGDTGSARYQAEMRLGDIGRTWSYESRMRLKRVDGVWKIVWSPSVIHPKLGKGERLAVVTGLPSRAPLLDRDGEPLVGPTPVVTIGVQPGEVERPKSAAAALARTLDTNAQQIRTDLRRSPPNSFVPVATLRQSEYRRVTSRIEDIDGVRSHTGTAPLPSHPTLAQAVLGRVGPAGPDSLHAGSGYEHPGDDVGLSGLQLAYQSRLAGSPGSKVVAQDASGQEAAVLATFFGTPSEPVSTTLDASTQRAAEGALDGIDSPAALVAVQASTGDILAVANANTSRNMAFTGRYSPGSAFEVVSTLALLRQGLNISDPVPCPSRRLVNGKSFGNAEGQVESTSASFRTVFSQSCNTAFIGLGRGLKTRGLIRSATDFGLAGDWSLPVPVFTGSIPRPSDDVQKVTSVIGQGGIQASPISMALVAAAVDTGSWRAPRLVTEPAQRDRPDPLPLSGVRPVRALMRHAVAEGSGNAADLPEGTAVYGKTGTAEANGNRSHAWFIGFRGDLAFAVFIKHGGMGGTAAAPVAGEFLRAAGSKYASAPATAVLPTSRDRGRPDRRSAN